MRTLLMYPDRDFDPERKPGRPEWELVQDLALDTLLHAMADDDALIADVARVALLAGGDLDTIRYRQDVLSDCLRNGATVRKLYHLALEATDRRRQPYFGLSGRFPSGILHSAVDMLVMLVGMLRKLRSINDLHAGGFASRGFTALFARIQEEIGDEYLDSVQDHLKRLRFSSGVLVGAELGKGNAGTNYTVRQATGKALSRFGRLFGGGTRRYTIRIHERDEAGARYLSELRDRGLNQVANAAAQSAEHVLGFFEMLKTELAFYVGCLNLRDRLEAMGAPMALPQPAAAGTRGLRSRGQYDVCLALTLGRPAVGNALEADGMSLVIITGANQGGKSSFLRSIGLAQAMMQAGMFVGAESFAGELCAGLFTHFKREEDPTMKQGKLEEDLGRMSDIVDGLGPNALLLLNESFAATNEREGSELAGQVVRALLAKRVRIFFVTHLYQFARVIAEGKHREALFLRAERLPDGTRTFKVVPGEPLETSHGDDLYRRIFAAQAGQRTEEYTSAHGDRPAQA
jgi:DNA mismatch repair ATPase MutS